MFNKLTTADTSGKIVVWINHDGNYIKDCLIIFTTNFKPFIIGAWYEEMVNKRDKTIITDMKWSSDGQHICIIYNDGKKITIQYSNKNFYFMFIIKVSLFWDH